ncbi:hypothetical protein DFP72DRAFT_1078358 [Ephemerocybe angulata]|uniref:Uncharacterized protein n=1 Tax=Ephemerocybe angulata TaxID=980116 RepID=A0A8H6HEF0_9AGAR|nr:hypothetical protein DFP72DRAFT_1078358 [Tulosesus angulatus]
MTALTRSQTTTLSISVGTRNRSGQRRSSRGVPPSNEAAKVTSKRSRSSVVSEKKYTASLGRGMSKQKGSTEGKPPRAFGGHRRSSLSKKVTKEVSSPKSSEPPAKRLVIRLPARRLKETTPKYETEEADEDVHHPVKPLTITLPAYAGLLVALNSQPDASSNGDNAAEDVGGVSTLMPGTDGLFALEQFSLYFDWDTETLQYDVPPETVDEYEDPEAKYWPAVKAQLEIEGSLSSMPGGRIEDDDAVGVMDDLSTQGMRFWDKEDLLPSQCCDPSKLGTTSSLRISSIVVLTTFIFA